MNLQIQTAVIARQISRLCHFTPSRNLAHIACDQIGVLATSRLTKDERKVFNPTDLQRLDGHVAHICCSIEYPNAWYFDRARTQERLFPDWVVLLIRPQYLSHDGTLFCPRNAAASYGRALSDGIAGFNSLFAESVSGAHGMTFTRSPARLPCVPTDEQAEVLVPDTIVLRDILAVAVRDATQAKNEAARLRLLGVAASFPFVLAPDLFDKRQLSSYLTKGVRPREEKWEPS